jgi:Zn-dependent protease
VLQELITPDKIILIAIFLLIGFPVHEFAHAFVAYRLGDATAKMFGRLTLNPVVHFDPIGGLFLVISVLASGFVFGWAKPTPVNPGNLRDRRNGEVLVSLAGPASNLIMAAVMAIVFRGLIAAGLDLPDLVWDVLFGFVFYNVALAVFNFIPIPPLDGASLLFRFLPLRYSWELRPILSQYGMFILLFFIFFGGRLISGVIENVALFLVGF